jgi:protein KRI1
MEPLVKRPRKLLDDCSDSGVDDAAQQSSESSDATPTLKINEEYARRFGHNKKREELQQCKFVYVSLLQRITY